MATITLSNAQTQDITRQILWNLWLSLNNDRIDEGSEPILFVQQLADKVKFLSDIHQSINTGIIDAGTKVLTQNENTLKFQSTSFSDASKDRDIIFQIDGTNLITNNASTRVNKITIDYAGTEYTTGAPKAPSNISQIESSIATWLTNYSPFAITNSVANDGEMLITALTTRNGKGEKYYTDDFGMRVTENETYQDNMQGNFVLDEQGSVNGLLRLFTHSGASTATDGSNSRTSLNISSQSGLQFDENQTFNGNVLIRLNHQYRNGDYNQVVNFSDAQENSLFATALTEFLNGTNNITDVTAALLSGNNRISAKVGNNSLNGFLGNDTLTGGRGNDLFQFTTALNASTNVDRISGFKRAGNDKIQLDDAIFSGFNGNDNFLVIGTRNIDADDRVLYDKNTGNLFYDADGSGAANAVQFAVLVGKPNLNASDIEII